MEDTPEVPMPGWVAALERAEADVVAGRIVDGAEARQRLRDTIKRMQVDAEIKAAQRG